MHGNLHRRAAAAQDRPPCRKRRRRFRSSPSLAAGTARTTFPLSQNARARIVDIRADERALGRR
jgi:hypothetical protein